MDERHYNVDEFPNRAPGSDPYYESICRSMVALKGGNERESIAQIGRSIDGFVAIGDVHGEGRARSKAVIVYRRFRQPQRALEEAKRALVCFQRHPDPGFEAHVYVELGQIEGDHGDAESALSQYEKGLANAGPFKVGEDEYLTSARAFLCDLMATCLAVAGQWTRVEGLRHSAIKDLKALNAPHLNRDLVITYCNLAKDYMYTGVRNKAGTALNDATQIINRMNQRGEIDPECQAIYDGTSAEFVG